MQSQEMGGRVSPSELAGDPKASERASSSTQITYFEEKKCMSVTSRQLSYSRKFTLPTYNEHYAAPAHLCIIPLIKMCKYTATMLCALEM